MTFRYYSMPTRLFAPELYTIIIVCKSKGTMVVAKNKVSWLPKRAVLSALR